MGLSRRAYAAHRAGLGLPGGTDTAVRKAIAAGRITIEADGSIDPAKADAQWAEVTDRAKQRGEASIAAGVERARATIEANEHLPVSPSAADAVEAETVGGQITYAKARAAREAIMAETAKLRLMRMRGELVSLREAEHHVFDLARKERDHWIQLPARAAANMAAELGVDAHAMEMVLDRVIREHLAILAEVKIDLADHEV